MNKKTWGIFILFLSGFILLGGSSASSIVYNSHYTTYSYLSAFNSKQNSKNVDNLSDGSTDVMVVKKIKRNRFDTNLVSDNFYKSLVKGESGVTQIEQFGKNNVILGTKENDLTGSLTNMILFTKQVDYSTEPLALVAFSKNIGLESKVNHTTYILSDTANSTIILLSVSSFGYFLISCKKEKIRRFNTKILSFTLASIIIGTIVLTPISTSSNFGQYTYGIIPFASADDGHDHSHSSEHCDETPHGVSAPTATALAGNKIVLSWAIPESEDDDHPITGYEIDYSTNGGVTWTTAVSNTTSYIPSYTVSGLVTGTSYNFRIEALNQCGQSQHLGAASTATVAGDVPSQVTGLSTTVISSSQINLSWTAPIYNAYPTRGYKIERSIDGVTFSTIVANTTTTATTYSDTGLSSNTLYYYRVFAINLLGTGSPSSIVTGIATSLPPTNISVTAVSSSQITLSWTAPSGTIRGYKIERSIDGVTFSTIVANTTTTATTYSDTGLSSNTLYYYRVSSIGSSGTSNPSSIASVTTSPTPPTSLLSSASSSQITLSWTAPSGTIRGYKIERSIDGVTFSTIVANTTTTATTYSDTGLSSNTLYSYRVSSLGIGGSISSPSGTTSIATIPSPPSGLVTTALAGHMMNISWTAPTGLAQITGYKIERSIDGSTWSTLVSNNNDGVKYQDSGLVLGQAYFYRVSAINSGGTSLPSIASTATTAGDVPSSVSSPSVTVFSGGIMNVTWTAPVTNGFPITSYKIENSTNGGAVYTTLSTITGNPPLTHFLATGLTIGSSYQWRIEAINSLGTSIPSAASTSAIALPPLKIKAQAISDTLEQGASYSISPNPNGQSTSVIISDGGSGDADGINDGIVTVNMVPFGAYNIVMTTIPSGFNVLGNSTIYTEGSTQLKGTTVFRLMPLSTVSSSLQSTVITTQPSLNNTVLTTWTSTFHATKINTTSTSISTVAQLPPILSAGNSNNQAIQQSVSNQATIQLDTTFSPTTSSSDIIKTLGVPQYSIPRLPDVVSVIPTIATTNDVHNGQIVTTPPLDTIVPGQQMIIPVQSSIIPSTGGLKEITVQSATSASTVGNPKSDWFVIRTNNTMPSSLPSLPSTVNKTTLFVNVTYSYETTGKGFNWGNPANFAHPPNMTLTIPKPASGVPTDSNGCPLSAIFVYDPHANSWTSNPVTIISTIPTVGNSNTCDVTVQTQHFSQFAVGTTFPTVTSRGSENSPVHPFLSSSRFTAPVLGENSDGGFGGILLESKKTIVAQVGKLVQLELNITAETGANYIQHVGFYTNLNGPSRTIQDSNTYIIYESGQPLEISNSGGILSSANVTAIPKGNNLDITFNIIFAKSMKTSDVIIRSWDQRKASFDNVLPNAIEVVDQPPLLDDKPLNMSQSNTQVQSQSQVNLTESVREWSGYSSKSISDSDMLHSFGLGGSHVPQWVMKNTKLIVDGTMTVQDFGNVLKYLSDNKIIK